MKNLWEKACYERGFQNRHIGTNTQDEQGMLKTLSFESIDKLVDAAVPSVILDKSKLDIPEARAEHQALEDLKKVMSKNNILRSMIGKGYYDCITPSVITRNVIESPAWYTQYTPYQAEIAQGRLEALINFQTLEV